MKQQLPDNWLSQELEKLDLAKMLGHEERSKNRMNKDYL